MVTTDNHRRQRRKDARPAELAAAALALFVEKGFAATRLDDVASRAGVSKGTLYLYFDSKEALFRAVIEESIVPMIGEVEAMVEQFKDDPAHLLRSLLVFWWERIGSTSLAGTCKLMLCEAGNFPEVAVYLNEKVIGPWHMLLNKVIEAGMQKGVFRPGNPESVRQMVFSPLLLQSVWQCSLHMCSSARPMPDNYFDTFFDVLFRGLLVEPTEESQR